MLRNTASQAIGAQMLTAADGSAFTGAVTVYVTGDNGTQAAGSVGSGACTHEGNGYHSYAPAQAETNYAHVAFTFIGTGAAPATVQVYTKTGDAFARLGAPVNASISADIAAVQADTDNMQTRLPAALVSGRMDASVGAMAANVLTATAINADAFTAAKFAADVTTELQTGLATSTALATAQADLDDIQTRLPAALVSGRIDASVGAMAANVQTAASTAADYVAEITAAVPTAAATATAVRTELATELARVDAAVTTRASATALAAVQTDTDDIQTRLPAALISGRIDATVGAMQADVMTSAATAASYVTELQSGLATAANLATVAGYIDTEVAAILAIANKLDTALELDGSVYRFTVNALEQAPTGSGGGSAPTAVEIANEVQTRTIAAVTVVNGLAAGVITAIQAGLATAAAQATLQADTDNIQTRLPVALVGGKMSADVGALLTTALAEDYAGRGDPASVAQLLYMLLSLLAERRVVGDVLTTGALDGSQAMTFLLDDVVSPTEQTRAS